MGAGCRFGPVDTISSWLGRLLGTISGCCRPAGVAPNEAAASLNAVYLNANEGALSMTRTTSASLLRMRGKASKQFVLRPGHLDFGVVKLDQVSSCMDMQLQI